MAYSSPGSSPNLSPRGRGPRPLWLGGLQLLGGMLALMWVLEIVDIALGGALDMYGIQAWDTDGLTGIVFAPFLHAGLAHLMANTVPLAVLGAVIAIGGALRLLAVTGVTALVSGAGAWLTSPPTTVTIGASGLVFGYATYLILRGVFNRKLGQIAIGVVVVFLWGGVLLGGLVPQAGVSWQGHLFGAIGGVLAAWLLAADKQDPSGRQGYSAR